MTIIEKNCYGLFEPSSGENQVNSVVSIDVAGLDRKAARKSGNLNRLLPDCRKLKVNPVVGQGGVGSPDMYASYIGEKVSVKILNRKLWTRLVRSNKRFLNLCSRRGGAAKHDKEQ